MDFSDNATVKQFLDVILDLLILTWWKLSVWLSDRHFIITILCLTVSVYPKSLESAAKILAWCFKRFSNFWRWSCVHLTSDKSTGQGISWFFTLDSSSCLGWFSSSMTLSLLTVALMKLILLSHELSIPASSWMTPMRVLRWSQASPSLKLTTRTLNWPFTGLTRVLTTTRFSR